MRQPNVTAGGDQVRQPLRQSSIERGYNNTKFDITRTRGLAIPPQRASERQLRTDPSTTYISRSTGSKYTTGTSHHHHHHHQTSVNKFSGQGLESAAILRRAGVTKQMKASSHSHTSRKNSRLTLPSPARSNVVNHLSRFANTVGNAPRPSVTPADLSRAVKRRRISNPLASKRNPLTSKR